MKKIRVTVSGTINRKTEKITDIFFEDTTKGKVYETLLSLILMSECRNVLDFGNGVVVKRNQYSKFEFTIAGIDFDYRELQNNYVERIK